MVVKHKNSNVGQCWSCKNCVGHTLVKVQPGSPYFKISGLVALPECKIVEAYMTHVYREKCPYFDRRYKEYLVPSEKIMLHPEIKNICLMCSSHKYCSKELWNHPDDTCEYFKLKKKNLKAARKTLKEHKRK